ncbi:S24 family peptidase [Pseudomonas sp. 21LCFQ010]|uniref:S24 family peptidase n=1 Tax=Pseudomonas sp. 21LCFQ010 TaxID=2957506 RepID=UPI00209845AC|nr:S24 family peptidase [Pseudomonas sp. 21LCFQ010]MCO8164824.1 S24 family peptidase [Pseudomonas sp. 21LCFQ010]
MTISNTRLQNFRRALTEKNMRLVDIADLLGKAPAQVSAFGGKNPTKGIGNKIAREIEQALDLDYGYLDLPQPPEVTLEAATEPHGSLTPVFDSKSAVIWCESEKVGEVEPVDWVSTPKKVGAKAFVLVIDGDSMEPNFTAGDQIVVEPALAYSSGQTVAVRRKGKNHATVRLLLQEGGERYLQAMNPYWPDRITKLTNEWIIYGRATWLIQKL